MTREKEIGLLMLDGCTEREAKRHLERGTAIIEDFEENFSQYMKEWDVDEEDQEPYRWMIKTGMPVADFGVVEYKGKNYYIMYVL